MGLLNRTKTKANGKIVICDFNCLNPEDFKPLINYGKKEMKKEAVLVDPSGKLYINSRVEGAEYVASVCEIIMGESQYTLEKYRKSIKTKYSKLSFESIAMMNASNKETTFFLAYSLIPLELNRRKIERSYYSR